MIYGTCLEKQVWLQLFSIYISSHTGYVKGDADESSVLIKDQADKYKQEGKSRVKSRIQVKLTTKTKRLLGKHWTLFTQ